MMRTATWPPVLPPGDEIRLTLDSDIGFLRWVDLFQSQQINL